MASKVQAITKEIRTNKIPYLMAVPGIVLLVLFCYIPFYYIVIAFKKYNYALGPWGSPWNDFAHFKTVFGEGGIGLRITFNTIWINFLILISGTAAAVGLSILINEVGSKAFKAITQTIYFFPFFLSWVVVGEIIFGMLSYDYGSVNKILTGLGFEAIQWYKHPEYWRTILVLSSIWKGAGYGTLIYLATMSGFNPEYFEAARIDGANRLQSIWRVTLPLLKPTVLILSLFSIGRIFFGDFGMVYGVVRDVGPILSEVEIIDTYVFRAFRQTGDFGIPVAVGLYQSFFGFLVVTLSNRFVKKINDGDALF